MQSDVFKILVIFVEPMLYGMDLIREVYNKTNYKYQFVYCNMGLTGRDKIQLPDNSFVCSGTKGERIKEIRNIFERFRPDFAIINGYVGTEQREAMRICRKNKIPYAIESDTPLNIPGNFLKAFAKKLYLKTVLGNRYCYGFPGGTLQKNNLVYYGIPKNRCFIMPMSVSADRLIEEKNRLVSKADLKKKYGLEGKKTFLFVGRLETVKNLTILLEAFKKLKEEYAETALVIVGDGTQEKLLKKIVAEENIKDVLFMGYVVFPRIIEFYKMSDVFVLPSCYEPWGLVINEAMSLGLPVIVSTDVGCREDLVFDGVNGFIFDSNNVIDLQKKLELIHNKNIESFSDNAYKRMQKWNYKYYLECFEGAVNYVKAN